MRKIIFSTLFCLTVVLLQGCKDDNYKTPDIESNRYTIAYRTVDAKKLPMLHIEAKNDAGGVTLKLSETSEPLFIKNDQLQTMLENFFKSDASLVTILKSLNYIDFLSNENLVVSYSDNGVEKIVPDMLKQDGSLKKSLKYRKDFYRIYPRVTADLAKYLGMPVQGELPQNYSFCHTTVDGLFLVYADKTTLKSFVDMSASFGVSPDILALINGIMSQYSKSSDVLNIGVYLRQL